MSTSKPLAFYDETTICFNAGSARTSLRSHQQDVQLLYSGEEREASAAGFRHGDGIY